MFWHPCPGNPAVAVQITACVQVAFASPHGFFLRIQSHLKTFYAASVMFLMALLHRVHSTLRTLWSEWPTNPLQPASMNMPLTLQPCSQQHCTHAHILHLKLNLCHWAPDCSSLVITVVLSTPLEPFEPIYGLTAWLESKGGIFTKSKTVTRVVPAYRSEAEIMQQFYDWGSHWPTVFSVVSDLVWSGVKVTLRWQIYLRLRDNNHCTKNLFSWHEM